MTWFIEHPALAVYLWSLLPNIFKLIGFTIFAALVAAWLELIFADKVYTAADAWNRLKKYVVYVSVATVTLTLAPSRETVAYMVAASITADAVQSDVGQKAIKLLEKEINSVLEPKQKN